jgi:hypothetical protein
VLHISTIQAVLGHSCGSSPPPPSCRSLFSTGARFALLQADLRYTSAQARAPMTQLRVLPASIVLQVWPR